MSLASKGTQTNPTRGSNSDKQTWSAWTSYGAYAVFTISLLLADFSRGIAGLKPGEIALVLLLGVLVVKRVLTRDFAFAVTPIDFGFFLLIAAGTVLPLVMVAARSIYINKEMINALVGPLEYYLWYRVFLEAIPMPARLPELTRVLLVIITLVSLIGLLQEIHFPGVTSTLLKFYPSANLNLSATNHRPTSVVGSWETLATLAAYMLILINQLQTAKAAATLGKYWTLLLWLMAGINAAALVVTLSFAGFICVITGFAIAWIYNRRLSRLTLILVGGSILALAAVLIYAPFAASRLGHSGGLALPATWQDRYVHWQVTAAVVFADLPTAIFGAQPSFTYPLTTFNSTESLYFLLLYRGGLIYLLAFIAFSVIVVAYLARLRKQADGFAQVMLTGGLTILLANFIIDIIDAHFFAAGESQVLLTVLALAVGAGLQTDQALVANASADSLAATMKRPKPFVMPAWMRRLEGVSRGALAGIALLGVVTAGFAWNHNRHIMPTATPIVTYSLSQNSTLAVENSLIGTSKWEIDLGANTTAIQGYAGVVSAQANDSVPLYISTTAPATYDIDVYRIGWYRGWGGRLITATHGLQSQTQGSWTMAAGLQQCATCNVDATTHRVEADWQKSYDLHIGANWLSGMYLIKLTEENAAHGESYIPLVVRDDASHAWGAISLPVNTWEAANTWGGYSLYGKDTTSTVVDQPDRATKVSFDRPYVNSAGAGDFLDYDIHLIRWMERINMDVTYTTNIDVSEQPNLLNQHAVLISSGHDAYWTQAMRDSIETAVNTQHLSLMAFGAQAGYWQARLEPDSAAQADRTLVCYKVATGASDPSMRLTDDPRYPKQAKLVTARWRDPVINRPENALLGIMYTGYAPGTSAYHPWVLPQQAALPYLESINTAMLPGEQFPGVQSDLFDGTIASDPAPTDLTIFGQSAVVDAANQQQTAYSVQFTSPGKHTIVFDAGTLNLSWALDDFNAPKADQPNVVGGNQKISNFAENLMRLFCQCGGAGG